MQKGKLKSKTCRLYEGDIRLLKVLAHKFGASESYIIRRALHVLAEKHQVPHPDGTHTQKPQPEG